ncbi:MAG: hypothetical protein KDK70_01530 [Myxococcales bacterium]|nr:hypothetical protein [Myxococcales bacterium]
MSPTDAPPHPDLHPIVAEIARPLSHPELLELAPRPLRGLPRIEPTPDPRLDAATVAQAFAAAPHDFQACRLAFLAGCMLELWPGFDDEGLVAAALLERAPALTLAAAKASRVLLRPPEVLDFRGLAARVGIHWDPGVPALLGAHLLGLGLMTALARSPALRAQARAQGELVGAVTVLCETVAELDPLRLLLDNVEQLTLLVLHPEQRRGFVIEAERVRNGFQLFALLDDRLLGASDPRPLHGPLVDPAVGAVARGEPVALDQERLTSPHGFYNWSAWTRGGLAADRAARLVWGELPIHRIPPLPRLDPTPVVILGTPWLDRGWPPSEITPLHPELRPQLTLVRTLDAEEVAEWLARIDAAPEPQRAALRYATTAPPPVPPGDPDRAP